MTSKGLYSDLLNCCPEADRNYVEYLSNAVLRIFRFICVRQFTIGPENNLVSLLKSSDCGLFGFLSLLLAISYPLINQEYFLYSSFDLNIFSSNVCFLSYPSIPGTVVFNFVLTFNIESKQALL